MSSLRVLLTGMALSLCLGPARAQSSTHVEGVAFPGGVTDGESAYVDAASGGVEALSLGSGAVRWHVRDLARPIAVAHGRVVMVSPATRPYELRLAVVEAASGKVVRLGDAFVLPSWVSIPPAYAHSFECHARLEHDRVIVWWHATAAWSHGMHPDEGQEEAARHDASGAVELALDSGHTRAVTDAPPPSAPPAVLPAKLLERYKVAPRLETTDHHHLLIKDGARWIVVERSSGRQLGSIAGDDVAEALVVGDRLFVSRRGPRRSVQAIDLKSGAVRWEHAMATPPNFLPPP